MLIFGEGFTTEGTEDTEGDAGLLCVFPLRPPGLRG